MRWGSSSVSSSCGSSSIDSDDVAGGEAEDAGERDREAGHDDAEHGGDEQHHAEVGDHLRRGQTVGPGAGHGARVRETGRCPDSTFQRVTA